MSNEDNWESRLSEALINGDTLGETFPELVRNKGTYYEVVSLPGHGASRNCTASIRDAANRAYLEHRYPHDFITEVGGQYGPCGFRSDTEVDQDLVDSFLEDDLLNPEPEYGLDEETEAEMELDERREAIDTYLWTGVLRPLVQDILAPAPVPEYLDGTTLEGGLLEALGRHFHWYHDGDQVVLETFEDDSDIDLPGDVCLALAHLNLI